MSKQYDTEPNGTVKAAGMLMDLQAERIKELEDALKEKMDKTDHELVLRTIKNYCGLDEEALNTESGDRISRAIELAYRIGHNGVPRVFGWEKEKTGELIHGINCECGDSCIENFCPNPECDECDMEGSTRCYECNTLMLFKSRWNVH